MSLLLSRRAHARCHIIRKNVISLMMAAEVVALAVRPSSLVWPSAAQVAVLVDATAVSPQNGLLLVLPVTTLLSPSAWAHQNWRMMLLRFPVPSTALPRKFFSSCIINQVHASFTVANVCFHSCAR